MPRSLSANAIDEIARHYGSEPISIVGIFWNGTQELKYADRDVVGIPGKILEISAIDDVARLDSKNSTASATVTLDDTDGDLKYFFDTYDLHKKKAIIYQYFYGLDISDAFVVMSGVINTPIAWNEGERKLTLTIVSELEVFEVGFAPEEGQFKNVAPQFVGKNWPVVFGNVLHVPATKTTEKIRGVTQTLIGIPDYTLPYKYWHLVERLETLRAGYLYYAQAVYHLQQISREPQQIIDQYIRTILLEDPRKQRHTDLTEFITENDKILEKLKLLLKEDQAKDVSLYPQNFQQTVIDPKDSNRGQQQEVVSTLKAIQQLLQDRADVQARVTQIEQPLTAAKEEAISLTNDLIKLGAVKKILEIETENAEYAYKNIHAIIKKTEKLLIDYVKTQHEIFKVTTIMEEHKKIPQNTVMVINGDKFPQNELVRVTINGLTFSGMFVGNQFNANTYEPRYENIKIAPREDNQIDAFWLEDSQINLKGHYCLTSFIIQPGDPEYILQQNGYPIATVQNRIFKVLDQVGRKCIMELVELKPSVRVQRAASGLPLLQDLPSEVWSALKYAREHTVQERERILENAIEKFEKSELERIKHTLEKLRDISILAQFDDEIAAVNETIHRNIHEYNDRVSHLRFTREAVIKADECISETEFKTLLKLCNLKSRLVDQTFYQESEIPILKIYYLTGSDITNIKASSPTMLPSWFQFAPGGQELTTDKTIVDLPNGTHVIADFLPDSGLWIAEPSSEIALVSDESEKYIANIIPSSVKTVYAYKAVNGIKNLVPVPQDYYTKNESDPYLPLTCTSITLRKPLKDYPGEDWEEGIYVSLASDVSPLTTDIIRWILANYTNLSHDTTTFNIVAAQIINFPSSFALLQKKDALQLISEIAWQARCLTWTKNGMMYIRYLSVEPDYTETITESDIEDSSLSVEYTSSEELVTKFVATWRPDYAKTEPYKLILRYNVSKYNEIEKEYEFYIYNNESIINKSATFWMIRYANTWKRIKFKTPLTKLGIETMDGVLINFAIPFVSTTPVKGIIEKANYDSASNSIEFECWLPIRAGELTTYDFAWPANISVEKFFPPIEDINAGYAGSFHGSVPKNLAYKIQPNTNLFEQLDLRPKDYGEAFPSDGAFVVPPNPLAGLSAENYIVLLPGQYTLPTPPRTSEQDAKPTYTNPVRSKADTDKIRNVFMARITEIVESSTGVYKVKDNAQQTYEVRQAGNQALLNIGQVVTVIKDKASNKYLINEQPSDTSGDTQTFLAEVTATSGAGKRSIYIVNVFDGKDLTATKSKPKESNVTAIQNDATQYFFNGELVVVRKIKNDWNIQKLSETTLRLNFKVGELSLRAAQIGSSSIIALNFTTSDHNYNLIDTYQDYRTIINFIDATNTNLNYSIIGNIFGKALVINFHKECLVPFLLKAGTKPFVVIKNFENQSYSGNISFFNYTSGSTFTFDKKDIRSVFKTPSVNINLDAKLSVSNDIDTGNFAVNIYGTYAKFNGSTTGSATANANVTFSGGSPSLDSGGSSTGTGNATYQITDAGGTDTVHVTTGTETRTIAVNASGNKASDGGAVSIGFIATTTTNLVNNLNDNARLNGQMQCIQVTISTQLSVNISGTANWDNRQLFVQRTIHTVGIIEDSEIVSIEIQSGIGSTNQFYSFISAIDNTPSFVNADLSYSFSKTVNTTLNIPNSFNIGFGPGSGTFLFEVIALTATGTQTGAVTIDG